MLLTLILGLINTTGDESSEGRVEVYRDNTWGTVCDDHAGPTDANAACRQWGTNTNAISWRGNAFYGQGTGPIHLDNLGCSNDPIESLFFCTLTFHDCTHAEDIGVKCPTVRKLIEIQTITMLMHWKCIFYTVIGSNADKNNAFSYL